MSKYVPPTKNAYFMIIPIIYNKLILDDQIKSTFLHFFFLYCILNQKMCWLYT